MSSYSRPIENDGSRSHEAFVADSARINNRAMSNRDPITNNARVLGRAVNHDIVLYATILSNSNLPVVTAKHSSWPNASSRTDYNVADDARARSDHRGRMDPWFPRAEFVDRHFLSSSNC